jgi:proteasome lid subunit RPN8/RPN11
VNAGFRAKALAGDLLRWARGRGRARELLPTSAEDDLDITVLEVEPLYPEPAFETIEKFVSAAEHLAPFDPDGPVVSISRHALVAAMSYADAHREMETGGLCLGRVLRDRDQDRLLISVEETLVAEHAVAGLIAHGEAFLTFTPDAWREMVDTYLRKFPDLILLGWYHSHPGIGIFLSSMDRFIYDSFFIQPWQIAMVVDPIQRQAGVFVRHQGHLPPPRLVAWSSGTQENYSNEHPATPTEQR